MSYCGKHQLLILLMIIGSFICHAQPEKANLYLSGNFRLSSISSKNGSAENTSVNYGISTALGFALKQNFIAGLSLAFSGNSNQQNGFDGKSTSTTYSTGAFLKYILPLEESRKFSFSPELVASFGDGVHKSYSSAGISSKTDVQSFHTGIRPAFSFYPTKRWGFELSAGLIGYTYSKSVDKANLPDEVNVLSKFSIDLLSSGLRIGVSYLFN